VNRIIGARLTTFLIATDCDQAIDENARTTELAPRREKQSCKIFGYDQTVVVAFN
jgi:hypothetical protein